MAREIQVNIIAPDGVDIQSVISKATIKHQMRAIKKILDDCVDNDERNRVIDDVLARIS